VLAIASPKKSRRFMILIPRLQDQTVPYPERFCTTVSNGRRCLKQVNRVDTAMSAFLSVIDHTGHYHARPSRARLSPLCTRFANNGAVGAAPAFCLRLTYLHVTHVWSPRLSHVDRNKHARNLLPRCLDLLLSDRILAQVSAGSARVRPATDRAQDKSREVRPGRIAKRFRNSGAKRDVRSRTAACDFV
jgi:hypothetical protein